MWTTWCDMYRSALGPSRTVSALPRGGAAGGATGGAAGGVAGVGVVDGRCAQASANITAASKSRRMLFLCLSASKDGHDFRAFTRNLEQFPSPLSHVGTPADQLLPFFGAGAKDPQVGDVLPVRRVRGGGGGCAGRLGGHREGSGGTISRVLFTRCIEQMVISLGSLSP